MDRPAAGLDDEAPPRPPDVVVDLDFEQSYVAPGVVIAGATNHGSAQVTVSVTTQSGGRITRADGPDSPSALRLPAYDGETPGAAAVMVVRSRGAEDQLAPGTRGFEFGASFDLDDVSSGSESDNGDNLLQRGLFADDAQFKLQVDHGVVSCRVAGAAGEALARSRRQVVRGVWYRADCTRVGRTVRLVVSRLDDQPTVVETVTVAARTGAVRMPASVPLAIGGKVAPDGLITASASDQFNGLIDDVVLRILS